MQKIPLDKNSGSKLYFELHLSNAALILGLVQISHGMAEHKARYQEFIGFLNKNGFHVAIHDHRGHGDHILDDQIGLFDHKDGWNWWSKICLPSIKILIGVFLICQKYY